MQTLYACKRDILYQTNVQLFDSVPKVDIDMIGDNIYVTVERSSDRR